MKINTSNLLNFYSKLIIQIMWLFSILLLLRGHNFPGGGFVGGLVAASANALFVLAKGRASRRLNRWLPSMNVVGILLIFLALLLSLVYGQYPLEGLWLNVTFMNNTVKLGSPLLFDIGIYCIVFASVTWILSELEGESS